MGSIGPNTTHHLYPAFPDNIITAPLVSISLAKLESGDQDESKAFFEAAKKLGFFYMKLEGSALGERMVDEAEQLHAIQQEFFKLPNEEKEVFAREKIDAFFGYRSVVQKEVEGRNETYNMRKDDFVGNSSPLPRHQLVDEKWDVLKSYVLDCRAAIDLMLSQLESHLQLPVGALASLHRITERSGDHVRFNQTCPQPFSEEKARLAEHTDFGTLTILMNWLGGLQIRLPEGKDGKAGDWVYVKPIPGHAVVNLGDACVKFTAGILRSNIHRVVPPPPPQAGLMRNSLVYFSRPEDAVVLRRVKGGLIDAQPLTDAERQGEEEMTAQEWTLRRSVGDLKGVYTHKGGLELREGQNGMRSVEVK